MNIKFKKLFYVFIVTLFAFYALLQIVYYTRSPIYFITDTIYLETTIKQQKTKLKYKALLNNKKVKYIVDRESNGSWKTYDYKPNSTIILSPYISMLYNIDDDFKFNNEFITIDIENEGQKYNATGDFISGFEKLALALKSDNKVVYLISSKAWPQSSTKAEAFERVFGEEGLTKISLTGDELDQKAYEIVDLINIDEEAQIVSTGATLISAFNKIDNNFYYNLEANQALAFDLNSLNYIIYEDLTPLVESHSTNIVLKTKLFNNQEGLVNFFLHLYRYLISQLF
ncbi:MAG: hypothetical protein PQJ45_09940 [Sphaerochaetaceae bacterium]|nr:hypothetical protein [Sphaerochaetaceae bacterium]